jgi:hypothetical protein
MEIQLSIILPHVLLLFIIFYSFRVIYKYSLHPNYRWNQRGNVCHFYRFNWSVLYSLLLFSLIELVINNVVTIKW